MSDIHDPGGTRLQKVLAQAGFGSRRACERLITGGRVTVNGQVANELGVRVGPTAIVHVDGRRVQLDPDLVTIALHKPAGVISAMSDSSSRPTLGDYATGYQQRLFHVGRLDEDSEGLILLTNDGELAHRLAHPSYEVPKTYVATVSGRMRPGTRKRLLTGVELDDGPAAADRARIIEASAAASIVEVEIHEGRNRIVRRLLAQVGHPVTRLVRTAFGTIRLAHLPAGSTREISGSELGELMAGVGL